MSRQVYPRYKTTGIEWLAEIPVHWEAKRLRFILSEPLKYGANESAELDDPDLPRYIRITDVHENGRLREDTFKSLPEDVAYPYLLKEGDLLFARSGATVGKSFYYESSWGRAAYAGYLIRARFNAEQIMPRFINYFTNSHQYWQWLGLSFIQATIQNVSAEKYANLVVTVPAIYEQRAIAAFLDRETVRIDMLIEKKRRQIELLQEKRFALIHQAIHHPGTKNLRLKHVVDHVSRPIDRKDEEVYTAVGLYNWARGIFHKDPKGGFDLGDSDFFWLKSDDLILSGQFAWEGAVSLASEEEEGCVVSHRYPVLRGKPDLMNTAYLWAFFTTKHGHFFLDDHSRGAAGRNRPLNINTLSKEVIPVPPLIEQKRVAEHVYFESRFKKVIARSIELLQEYRAALISAVVAGKIDVRDSIKKRPEQFKRG